MAASNFDTTRLRLGDMVAGISGVILLISLWLHWYSASAKGLLGGSVSGGISGWQILSFIDILLFLIALIAIAVPVARAANAFPRNMPASPGLIVLAAGALAVLLVLFRLLVLPGDLSDVNDLPGVDVSRSFGIFLALLAAIGVAVGGWMTWKEEGQPRPGGVGAGAGPGTPVGGGQPYGGQPAGTGYQPQQQQAAAPPAAATPGAGPEAQPAAPAPAAGAAPAGTDAPPPGGAADWYPDPRGEKRLRYWDGSEWTHHTAD